ncbi:MAG: high frequency lysogenization protein HflD [Gammaproteobacteria bacterium]|nr:high frequency lysogenization protein HflD [Gammaproteobacteria bacterium]
MSKTITDRTLALAGVFLAAEQVQSVARRGRVEPEAFQTAVQSLFKIDATDTDDVYGGRANLRPGLRALLANIRAKPQTRDLEQMRYTISLLHLERRLARRRELLDAIGNGIALTQKKVQLFSLTHDNVVAALADIYVNTVSTLTPRIMVAGEHGHLSHAENANRVRALLLAGIRSAVLWHQSGGSRMGLLFRRGAYAKEAERLLGSL